MAVSGYPTAWPPLKRGASAIAIFGGVDLMPVQSGNAKAETRRLRPAARRDIRDALDRDALDEAPAAYLDWGARIIGEPLR